jgi:hypothetical protein
VGWFDDIFDWIGDNILPVAAATVAVVTGQPELLGIDAWGEAAEIVDEIVGVIGAGEEAAAAVELSVSAAAVASVASAVKSVTETVKPVVDTIAGVTSTVSTIVNAVNDGILKPIIDPLLKTYTTIEALIKIIDRDWSEGIKGILRIPQDIANAMNSIDASFQRAAKMLNAGAASNISALLTPALAYIANAPLEKWSAGFVDPVRRQGAAWSAPPHLTLGTSPDVQSYKDYAKQQQDDLTNDASLPAQFWKMVFKAIGTLGGLALQNKPYLTLWAQEIARAFPTELLDSGSLSEGLRRGLINADQVKDELRTQGYDAGRSELLTQLSTKLLDAGTLLECLHRDAINDEQARQSLALLGFSAGAIDLILAASESLLSAGDLRGAFYQGVITEDTYKAGLRRLGFSDTSIEIAFGALFAPATPQALIEQWSRRPATQDSGIFSTYELTPPDYLVTAGRAVGQSPEATQTQWLAHWQLLSPAAAVQGYFRNRFSAQQLQHFLDAWSLPRALQADYIELQRPLISARSITTLMAQGIIAQSDAMDILRSRGFSDVEANWLIQIEKAASAPSQSTGADELHGLTQSVVMQLYDAGTLDRAGAESTLVALGVGAQAVGALLDLQDIKEGAAYRASQIALVTARAKSGLITYDDAIGALSSLDLTPSEINKALAALQTTLAEHVKLPSESQMFNLYRYGIFNRTETADALALLGYSTAWAEVLIQLNEATHATKSE